MENQPIRLYIVEDELLITASLRQQLEAFGYVVVGTAIRGENCLRDLYELRDKSMEPEIVLMDIHLRGEMDGIETAQKIIDEFDCGIIFITGQSSKEVYDRSFRIKPFGYLLKPIDLEQTKMTVEIAAYQRQLEIENKKYQNSLVSLLAERTREKEDLLEVYEVIVKNSLMGMVIMQEGRFIFANDYAAHLFGYAPEEFMQLNKDLILQHFHPDDIAKAFMMIPAITPREGYSGNIIRILTRNGQEKTIMAYVLSLIHI
jgi:PAS domain S-box-containing protein